MTCVHTCIDTRAGARVDARWQPGAGQLLHAARTIMTAILLAACSLAIANNDALPTARNLAADGQSAEQYGLPLIVIVSLAGCPHCDVVRRSHLLPLLRDTAGAPRAPRAIIRQVEVNGSERVRDFNGKDMSHAEFARQYKASIAPVVFFFNAKGQLLAAPLVGSMIPDFYGAYFDAALNEAGSKLREAQLRNR